MVQRFNNIIIAVDFDGTCVEHEYPEVGQEVPGCLVVLDALAKGGHRIILYTMRSGKHLEDAVKWFEERKIPLWGINGNPEQISWTTSPKPYAQIYIDDAALGCPLLPQPSCKRPIVDWREVYNELLKREIIGE